MLLWPYLLRQLKRLISKKGTALLSNTLPGFGVLAGSPALASLLLPFDDGELAQRIGLVALLHCDSFISFSDSQRAFSIHKIGIDCIKVGLDNEDDLDFMADR